MKLSKKMMLSFAAITAVGATVFSLSTTAAPSYMTETTYFNDAAHTSEVGYRFRACNGRTFTSGTVTIYKEVSSEPCF